MPLSTDFMEELRSRVNIVDLVSEYVNLRRSGSNMVGICPFHSENTASFFVYPDTWSFYCFGCLAGGDAIGFIKRIENLDYINAVKFLADKSGLEVPKYSFDDSDYKSRQRIFEANREAAKFFNSELYEKSGSEAVSYLKRRSIEEKTARHFGMGYAPKSGVSLVNYLLGKKFKESEIISANLGYRSVNGNLRDRFYGRLMFPIIDMRGSVVAFGGRTLSDGQPKYLNTSDTKVFKKGSNLFALNFAKHVGSRRLILVEGYMDVVSLHQSGFKEAIATLGTAINERQAKIMKNYADEVLIAYDSDEAGRRATERAIEILRRVGFVVKVVNIPKGKDPDEFIRYFKEEGFTRFNKLLNTSLNDIEYKILKLKSEFDIETSEGKILFLKRCVEILSKLSNDVERDIYTTKIALSFDVEKLALKRQVEKEIKKQGRSQSKIEFKKISDNLNGLFDKANPDKKGNLRAAKAEEALISYLIRNKDKSQDIFKVLEVSDFCTEFNKKVYSHIKNILREKESLSISDFTPYFSDEEMGNITRLFLPNGVINDSEVFYKDCIEVILQERERMRIKEENLENIRDIKGYLETLKKNKK